MLALHCYQLCPAVLYSLFNQPGLPSIIAQPQARLINHNCFILGYSLQGGITAATHKQSQQHFGSKYFGYESFNPQGFISRYFPLKVKLLLTGIWPAGMKTMGPPPFTLIFRKNFPYFRVCLPVQGYLNF